MRTGRAGVSRRARRRYHAVTHSECVPVARSARPGPATSVRPCRAAVAAQRRRPGVRRRGVPARPAWTRCSPSPTLGTTGLEVVVVDDGSPDDVGRDRRVVRRPGRAGARRAHRRTRASGAARNEGLRHVTGDLLAFADSDDVVPPGAYAALLRPADPHRLGLRDRLGGALGGRDEPGRAAVDAAAAPPADRTSSSTTCRRSSATCSRGTSCSAPTSGATPGCPGPRGSATRTSRPPRWPTCAPGGSGSCPRSSTTGGSAPTAPRSPSSARRSQDLRDRWETKRMALRSVEEYGAAEGHRGVPRPGAGRRPAPLLRRDPGLRRRVVGAAPRPASSRSGAPARSPTAACCPSTGWSAGWSSRAVARTPPRWWPTRRDLGRPRRPGRDARRAAHRRTGPRSDHRRPGGPGPPRHRAVTTC